MTEHDTMFYILKDLVENMNSSFNSGIMCTPNDANKNENKMNIEQLATQKMIDEVLENKNKNLKLMIMSDVY